MEHTKVVGPEQAVTGNKWSIETYLRIKPFRGDDIEPIQYKLEGNVYDY